MQGERKKCIVFSNQVPRQNPIIGDEILFSGKFRSEYIIFKLLFEKKLGIEFTLLWLSFIIMAFFWIWFSQTLGKVENVDRLWNVTLELVVVFDRWDIPSSSKGGLSEWWQQISSHDLGDMCCILHFTLDQQAVFSVLRITGVANHPQKMWLNSKKHQLLLTWTPEPGVGPRS